MKYSHEVPHLTLATVGEGKRTVTVVVGVLCGEGSPPSAGCAQLTTGCLITGSREYKQTVKTPEKNPHPVLGMMRNFP